MKSPILLLAAILSISLSFSRSADADALDNWTTNQVSTNWFGLSHVAYGNGRYVAAGSWSDYGAILSSEDGFNWTLRATGTNSGIGIVNSLQYQNGRFLITGSPFGNSWGFSTNGINWTIRLFGGFDNIRGMAYGAGRYVLALNDNGGSSKNMYYSDDGVNVHETMEFPTDEVRGVLDVAYGSGIFAAVAKGGYIYLSSGDIMQRLDFPDVPGGDTITFAIGRFFVPSNAGTNYVSVDGVTWRAVGTGLTNKLGKITFANGTFYARADNYLATSRDGTNWTQHSSSPLPGNGGIATDGRRFVNVGRGPTIGCCSYPASFIYVSGPLVEIGITNGPQQVILSGLTGRTYRIEFAPSLQSGTNAWQPLPNLILSNSPSFISDPTEGITQRFYRAVLLP